HAQRVEAGGARYGDLGLRCRHRYSSFMCSKGSRQAVQRRSAVHEVGPNRETSSVAGEPQRGQRTTEVGGGASASGTGPARRGPTRSGGAMPCSASLRRPCGVIQSVLHGGESTVRTSTLRYP